MGTEEFREFTLTELAEYNGETRVKIYVSIGGNVFDVTDSGFYSSSGRYHVFAGKDLTLCLIKSSLDPAMTNNLNMEQEGITTGQIEGKVDFYRKKYKRVGWLKEWKDINGDKAIYSS